MKLDSRGLQVTTNSSEAIAAIDRYVDAAVSLRPGIEQILAAAKAEPDCAMLQASAASLYIYLQSKEQARGAAPYLARAQKHLERVTERERIFIEAVAAGCAGDFERALELHERIIEKWPSDMFAAKLAEFHFFETGHLARQLRFMEKIAPRDADVKHAKAMLGFALELNARRAEAADAARAALDQDPEEIWAQHCLAHVWSGEGKLDEGIAAMEAFAPTWARFNPFVQSHNPFHLAVMYRDRLDFERVLDLYSNHVWGSEPESIAQHTDAILLLWYLELAGGDAGDLWRDMAPHIRVNAHEQTFPFLNAIYFYALERAGESAEVDRALEEMRRYAESQIGTRAEVWGWVGIGQARASVAFARGEYARAAGLFGQVLPKIAIGGGSDEQRGVFNESHFVALIKAGRLTDAARALEQHQSGRALTPVDEYWLQQARS